MTFPTNVIAKALGLNGNAGMSPLALLSAIEGGLPVRSLDLLAELVAPADTAFKYRIVPKATLGRRKAGESAKLSREEGERAARLAEVWALAMEIWGDADTVRVFLGRPHPLLDGTRPLDLVLASEIGARLVRDVLERGRYGSAA